MFEVGSIVNVVHNLEPHYRSDQAVVMSFPRVDGLVPCRFASGGYFFVDPVMIDPTDPEVRRITLVALAGRCKPRHWLALAAFHDAGPDGLIDHDHQAINNLNTSQARHAREDLEKWGLVEYVGNTRPSPRHKHVHVYRITGRGTAVCDLHPHRGQ